ncbi:hypothetical protein RM704_12230 [Streptomyces sp. DSM 3412]|uniref:Uncharacterized protein n=1 Tax=Streptomyces gottesmaniae TaxID=3075518 RepID=A0ABU2YVG8_9ACTN|nr:hypothetical protein [Streptomyces sp. DSM 3412]MDT0568231.1 hypothetical protein [Streptomyces sp. DSM 3412]
MEGPDGIERRVARVDAALRPIAEEPVDLSDPDWAEKTRQRPDAMDAAGVRTEAQVVLRSLLTAYADGDDELRASLRGLLARHTAFRWGVRLPAEPTPEGFRLRLLHLSAVDQGSDTRDELLTLRDLCEDARRAGIDLGPLLREVAELSSHEDKYGMGSLRDILLRAAG